VVERVIGNDEVDSSILSSSTIIHPRNPSFLPFLTFHYYTNMLQEGMEMTYALTRNKRSSKWQFRKRYPSDVARILPGEFVKSTGEEEKKAAQARVPLIAAEYERRVAEARAQLAEAPPVTLGKPQILAMAAQFYAEGLDAYTLKHAVGPEEHRRALQDLQERLEYAEGAMRRHDFNVVRPAVERRAKEAGLGLADDSPEMVELLQQHMRAYIDAHRHCVAVLSGEGDLAPTPWGTVETSADTSPRTMASVLTAYEAEKSAGWSASSKKSFAPVARLLRDVFADREVGTITREEAKNVRTLLQALPAALGRQKALAGLSIRDAVKQGSELGLPVISAKTINSQYLVTIAAVFNWAIAEQLATANPFKGLSVVDPVAATDRRDRFEVPQLNKLFKSGPWAYPWADDGRKSGAYWVPLLCLFHGLRLAEAAGLRVEDVGEEAGVPVLRIVPYEGRTLKTADARATLPIHPELQRLGFITFVDAQREAGAVLLFPDGAATKGREVGANLGAWFSRHVRRLELEGTKLGMHSFRHNFEDALREAQLPDRTALALARRTEAGSSSVYGGGLSTALKAEALAKVAYPDLDLLHLCRK
jgi:integrase